MEQQGQLAPRLIGALLRASYLTVTSRVSDALALAGYEDLHAAHLSVVQQIDEEVGSRLTDLAAGAQITKQSMGYLVDYLEERGYVERAPDPSDGRGKIVRLTERGHEVMKSVRAAVHDVEDEWAGVVGERRLKELKETLGEIVLLLESEQTARNSRSAT